jgi:purine-binding chemotaxis protein CheW
MRTTGHLLEVLLDSTRVGFPLECIDRVLRAVAVHEVPAPGTCLLGAIDLAGELVSVYDMRKLLGLPSRPLRAADRMVLTRAPARCALLVDEVLGTVCPESLELSAEFGVHAAGLRGVARTGDRVLLVHDLRRLLALERALPLAGHG